MAEQRRATSRGFFRSLHRSFLRFKNVQRFWQMGRSSWDLGAKSLHKNTWFQATKLNQSTYYRSGFVDLRQQLWKITCASLITPSEPQNLPTCHLCIECLSMSFTHFCHVGFAPNPLTWWLWPFSKPRLRCVAPPWTSLSARHPLRLEEFHPLDPRRPDVAVHWHVWDVLWHDWHVLYRCWV